MAQIVIRNLASMLNRLQIIFKFEVSLRSQKYYGFNFTSFLTKIMNFHLVAIDGGNYRQNYHVFYSIFHHGWRKFQIWCFEMTQKARFFQLPMIGLHFPGLFQKFRPPLFRNPRSPIIIGRGWSMVSILAKRPYFFPKPKSLFLP